MEVLSPEQIRAGFNTSFVGQNLLYLPETASTNDKARCLAEAGAPEGTLVITDYQTAGRGRLGRQWVAPPGSSLLMSLLFRPALAPYQVQRLTMVCGLAAADAAETATGLQVGLKWPNDLVIGAWKAGGILTEVESAGGRVAYAIVGIGLNVNLDPDQLPGDLLLPATSLSREAGRPVDRLQLLWILLREVEQRYLALQAGQSPHRAWAERLVTLGQPVVVTAPGGVSVGIAEGVDENGALLVRQVDGTLETVLAGDVTLRSEG